MVEWWWILVAAVGGFAIGFALMSAFVSGKREDRRAGIGNG